MLNFRRMRSGITREAIVKGVRKESKLDILAA
jgi:hypothetical protein